MRTEQERLSLMHEKAAMYRKKRDRAELRAWGGAAAGLSLCLLALSASVLGPGHGISAETETASSLLKESAGGYVLTAVVAFMLGVSIMAFKFYRNSKGKKK